ncbi:MAG: hypothetical protein RBS72_05885 [Sedimentisphaerales bacterium]|jgi:hypothetical protein|nr:hypothetical protein [Sedimentisphaerales bacterium]HNY79328.1 hypothetical protein [Sedimentisphaerales bacterium]HOC64474.1 hypothetical protein [Sedimentisphaerales bacterium]HOH63337.1 hypothetical protein [Sedimentisphaerales bacterium]HPY49944.1 hypothetical protein [Sedimentisphaerales bacterium]
MYRSPIESGRRSSGAVGHRVLLLVAAVVVAALQGGCESPQNGNGMAGSFYLNPYKDLANLGRIALVELDNNSGHPQISADLTEALFVALQKKQVFGLTIVHQDNPDWRGLQQNLDSLQALRQLLATRETLKCNGLLVGTVTEYTPYPHMSLGLRLKLLDLTDGQLIWGLEQVWDSSDRDIQKRIKRYFKDDLRTGFASLREELVVVSPLKFGKFVAYEVAETFERPEQ